MIVWPWAVLAGLGFLLRRRQEAQGLVTPRDGATFAPEEAQSTGRELSFALPLTQVGRDELIVALAASGHVPAPEYAPVTYTKDGHTVTIAAALRPLTIGEEDPILLTVTHGTAQRLADFFGAMLPTTRFADAAWLSASHIAPQLGPSGATMATTAEMVKHSDRVAAAMGSMPGLVRDQGKDWVNTEQLLKADGVTPAEPRDENGNPIKGQIAAANFGWHVKTGSSISPGGLPVLQSVGLRHNLPHVDYSQVVTLYGKEVVIDGVHMKVEDAMKNPALAYLVSDEVLKGQRARVWRHPAIPEMSAS